MSAIQRIWSIIRGVKLKPWGCCVWVGPEPWLIHLTVVLRSCCLNRIWIIVSPSLQHRGRRRWPMIALGSMTQLISWCDSTPMPSICIPSSNSSWNMASIDGFQISAQRFHGFNLQLRTFRSFSWWKNHWFQMPFPCCRCLSMEISKPQKVGVLVDGFWYNNSLIEVGGIN